MRLKVKVKSIFFLDFADRLTYQMCAGTLLAPTTSPPVGKLLPAGSPSTLYMYSSDSEHLVENSRWLDLALPILACFQIGRSSLAECKFHPKGILLMQWSDMQMPLTATLPRNLPQTALLTARMWGEHVHWQRSQRWGKPYVWHGITAICTATMFDRCVYISNAFLVLSVYGMQYVYTYQTPGSNCVTSSDCPSDQYCATQGPAGSQTVCYPLAFLCASGGSPLPTASPPPPGELEWWTISILCDTQYKTKNPYYSRLASQS